MNKKGFTLTELLVVVVILLLVMGTSVIGMQKISEESKIKNLKRIKTEVEEATEVYFTDNNIYEQNLLNGSADEICTRLYVLINKGYIDMDLTNPLTGKRLPGNLCVVSKVNSENNIIEHRFEYIDKLIRDYELR